MLHTYDDPALSDESLFARTKEWKPDVIVYIGSRWGKQPAIATLSDINAKIAPMVHLCSDAADNPWWDQLRAYHQSGCFALQVTIDGSHKWPTSNANLTLLTPVDPAFYPEHPTPHAQRMVVSGYAGNPGAGPGSNRTAMLAALLERKAIDQLHIRSNLPHTYEMCARFLGMIRISINVAWTGTEQSMHVKGRVLESALAGAMLLETKGSPTSHWFTPGEDYLEYETADEAAEIIKALSDKPQETEVMAMRLRAKVLYEHTPARFWEKVFDRLGMKMAA